MSTGDGSAAAHLRKVGVVGGGQMGTGIAKVAAHVASREVVVVDISEDVLDKSRKFVEKLVAKDVEKGRIEADAAQAITARFSTSTDMKSLADCDIVIEAATENQDLKGKIFRQLDEVCKPGAILASNTSSISITKIAAATQRPESVVGMHFMNPVPVMKLVEIIQGLATSPEVHASTISLAREMGKTTTESRDVPGFIANRLLCPYINEAFFALYEGIGSPEDIDTTMKLGTNVPMGPLTLADFIGLDTVLAIMRVLHEELGEDKYRPCPLLVKHVEAGWYGKKTGRGVFKY